LSDAEAIAAVLRAAFADFEPLYTPRAFAATTPTPEQLAGRFRDGPIWLAEQESQVLGTVSGVPRPNDLYVRSMAVHPDAQGRGIGVGLLRMVEDFAVLRGHGRLLLTTTPFLSRAIRLYQQAGFQRTGETGDLFGTPLIWMVMDVAQRRSSTAPP
jgi:GNAT superfamily N-acetyltransferase